MNPDGGILPSLLFLLLFVAFSAFLTCGKTALDTASENTLKKMAEENSSLARKNEKLQQLLKNSEKVLSTARLGITLCSVFTASIFILTFFPRISGSLEGTILSLAAFILSGLLTGCILFLFGRLVPYRLALKSPEKTALSMASALSVYSKLFYPLEWLLSVASNFVLRLFGIDPHQLVEQVTEEEIRMMVDLGNESGSIEQSEREMINNIFEFDDRTAGEVMTHRTAMIAVPMDITLPEIIRFAVDEGCSRIPVYEDDIDNIIGVLYVKDLLKFVIEPPADNFDIRNYMRSALFVPETTRCEDLLQQLKSKKLQMAIVVDEYGGTSGLVTMEDLLESIVGNIQDEYDDEEENIVRLGENSYLINGTTPLDEVEKLLGISFPDDTEYDTLGGYITEQLDHIPADNEKASIQVENVLFTVISTEERRIAKVRAEHHLTVSNSEEN